MYIRIKWPFKATIVGKTGTGKTFLLKHLITHGDIEAPLEIYVICNKESIYQWEKFKFKSRDGTIHKTKAFVLNDFPTNILPGSLVIMDDNDHMNDEIADIFTTRSHHNNLSVVVLVHKINTNRPETRTSSDFMIFTGDVTLVENSLKQLGEQKHIKKIVPYMTKNRGNDFNLKEFRNVVLVSNDASHPYWVVDFTKIRPLGLRKLDL